MNSKKRKNTGFLFDINDARFNVLLEESIKNNTLSVVAASGKVGDCDLISRLYTVRHELDNKDFEVREYYTDDGKNFTASVSFIKKPRQF